MSLHGERAAIAPLVSHRAARISSGGAEGKIRDPPAGNTSGTCGDSLPEAALRRHRRHGPLHFPHLLERGPFITTGADRFAIIARTMLFEMFTAASFFKSGGGKVMTGLLGAGVVGSLLFWQFGDREMMGQIIGGIFS